MLGANRGENPPEREITERKTQISNKQQITKSEIKKQKGAPRESREAPCFIGRTQFSRGLCDYLKNGSRMLTRFRWAGVAWLAG